MRLSKSQMTWLALGAPVAVLLVAGLIAGISAAVIGHTLVGMLGAAIGGLAGGVTAKRFLANARNDGEVLYGIGAVTAIGVVAIGYIYLFYIDNALRTIGTPERAIEQACIFVEFLAAQYVGTLWAERFLPELKAEGRKQKEESTNEAQDA